MPRRHQPGMHRRRQEDRDRRTKGFNRGIGCPPRGGASSCLVILIDLPPLGDFGHGVLLGCLVMVVCVVVGLVLVHPCCSRVVEVGVSPGAPPSASRRRWWWRRRRWSASQPPVVLVGLSLGSCSEWRPSSVAFFVVVLIVGLRACRLRLRLVLGRLCSGSPSWRRSGLGAGFRRGSLGGAGALVCLAFSFWVVLEGGAAACPSSVRPSAVGAAFGHCLAVVRVVRARALQAALFFRSAAACCMADFGASSAELW